MSRSLVPLVALAALLVLASGGASAHKTAYSADGKVKIVWGFLEEPAVTYEHTGVDLILRDNVTGVPLEGAEKTLKASLVLGDLSHPFTLRPQSDKKGSYTDAVTLTRPGLYGLRLVGTVNGSALDLTIPAQHEVSDVRTSYFPEADGPAQMAQRLKTLEEQVAALKATSSAQSSTPADVTTQPPNKVPAPGLAPLLALVAAVALLALRRR